MLLLLKLLQKADQVYKLKTIKFPTAGRWPRHLVPHNLFLTFILPPFEGKSDISINHRDPCPRLHIFWLVVWLAMVV